MKKIICFVLISMLAVSCKDDDTIETTSIEISFANTINSQNIELNTGVYQTTLGESYSINELKYIISNISFIKEDGGIFTYPVEDSYFLIDEEVPSSKIITLENIPVANYNKIKFGIGVDQSNYPLNGVDNFVPTAEESQMLWSWSAGYIFFKIEGDYSSTGDQPDEDFLFHIGSHGTNLDNYKTVELSSDFGFDFTESTLVSIEADIPKLFNAVYDIRIEDKSDIQVDPVNAPKIAENASRLFSSVPFNLPE
ncbi:AZL_007920/MXAN_0976 family protein [Psychroflexus torquis ATCC 700755]|uniref:AZL_007920/MXAN_0976 family protein n=1 Tax=Psychroflexus torquis (strain ATCC 700755 / CIP 106069 / ACAM 623) TaxID=313595 RepID=K4IRI6_PSYTT|nr:MbnP family protein [Psychroflexus torquis]AFU68070.1 AZL_007920/MXAN_0976 family protein [Psychroflexus torquis ATCC 700755]